jgi:hypothetical protein
MTPKAILSRLEVVIGVRGSPRRLGAAIEEQLRDHFGLSPLSAAERAEEVEKSVAALIERKRQEADHAGTLAMLVLSNASSASWWEQLLSQGIKSILAITTFLRTCNCARSIHCSP